MSDIGVLLNMVNNNQLRRKAYIPNVLPANCAEKLADIVTVSSLLTLIMQC